ncbi:RagB/SusD domain-containing protein [Salegentibacter echinorum]|uniref:RagB/SusD domain-containing protein n=1 Tax=Salegentibacter echinorum TaxID=1073325 RepID=A0A1M5MD24_SALEC|nr:RagB/SusD family nutrient uptake outer membrane protein [Salegentibacter echinorum]SHG75218.1 RagB/SusD domain-containing protein [Salegentibacter echinorum]
MKLKYIIVAVFSFGLFYSCSEEDLDPTLSQDKSIETSINTVNDLQSVIYGAYNRMSLTEYYGRDIIILGEIFSDNVYSNANSNRFVVEGKMDLNSESGIVDDLWSQLYAVIGSSNVVINAEDIEGDEAVINHFKGEAYAIRALAHFNLVEFYGQQNVNGGGETAQGVPYVTKFRDEESLFPARNTVGEVKQMAYDDLDMALSLMSEDLNDPTKEYITTFAVQAIKSRIANYFEDWDISLAAAETIVQSGNYDIAGKDDFLTSFSTDGEKAAIFEIANTPTDNPGINGLANIYQEGSYGDVVVLPNLASIYEEGDVRGIGGIITEYESGALRNTGKYPSTAPYEDNIAVIRYAEVVLLYAEALLETGNTSEALIWLNKIPSQRGASTYSTATKDNILLERRKELAFEGFRFHDLARTGMDIPAPDSVQQAHGGPAYGSYNFALPIPFAEVDANGNIDQNEGY